MSLGLLTVVVTSLFAQAPQTTSPVQVELQSGRVFEAAVDIRSDEQTLWLRFEQGSTRLLRPIKWDRVKEVRHQGQAITREAALDLASKESPRRQIPATATPNQSIAQQTNDALDFAPRIRSIQIEARLANWDHDSEDDGIVMWVYPIDATGSPVAVTGTVQATLIGTKSVDFNEAPRSRGVMNRRYATWTRTLTESGKGRNNALYLEFPTRELAKNSTWLPLGLLHVRLVVPGHGVFETTQEIVRVRRFSPIRDREERTYQRRVVQGR